MAWLQQARFGPYELSLAYQTRPDVVQRAFAGSLRSMAQRLSSLTLNVNLAPPGADEESRMVREWRLAYAQDARSDLSLLQSVSMRGAPGAAGVVAAWPDLKLHIEKTAAPAIIELPFAQLPPSPANARVGVLSWFGNGRPSLYQVREGELLVWSDEPALAAMPLVAQGVPAELAQYSGRTAFSDVGGDGMSDLVLLGDDIAGHFAFQPGKGFGDFQPWDLAEIPAGVVFQRNASLCDVDGDGRNEIVFYDDAAAVWKVLIPGGAHGAGRLEELSGELPDERLDGKFRQLADLSGDGLADFVEIADGEVRTWMNCGDMKFAAPREMPFDHGELLQPDGQRLGFADLTGDGAGDLYAVEPGRVHYWLNQGAQRFVYQGAIELPGMPGIEDVLVCDWLGLSRSGFLWWADDGRVRFASPVGTGLPGALREVDNGLGLTQEFSWSTTAVQSALARAGGAAWQRELPFALRVCDAVTTRDAINATRHGMSYGYGDPAYWSLERRFLGFVRTEISETDAALQPLRRTSITHRMPAPDDINPALEEISLAGSPQFMRLYEAGKNLPLVTLAHEMRAHVLSGNGGDALAASPLVLRSVTEHHNTQGAVYSRATVEQLYHDMHGRPGRVVETTESFISLVVAKPAGLVGLVVPPSRRYMQSSIEYSADAPQRFLDRRSAVTQSDGDGRLVSATRMHYDGLPSGQVGQNGRLTTVYSQVHTAEQAAALGGDAAAIESLGYLQVDGQTGWWRREQQVDESRDSMQRRVMTATDSLGNTVASTYDPWGIWVVEQAGSNGVHRLFEPDSASNRPAAQTDEFGTRRSHEYDGLGRITSTAESGIASPVEQYSSQFVAGSGMHVHVFTLMDDVVPSYRELRQRLDAHGREIDSTQLCGATQAWSMGGRRLDADGRLIARSVPHAVDASTAGAQDAGLPGWRYTYDALNRVVLAEQPDGSARALVYDGPWVSEFDATRPDVARRRICTDASGHVVLAARGADNDAVASFERDVRGSVVRAVDLYGRKSNFEYDLLGRLVRSETPDGGEERIVIDALGQVRRTLRNGAKGVAHAFDSTGRLMTTQSAGRDVVEFEYAPVSQTAGSGMPVAILSAAGRQDVEYDRRQRVSQRRFVRRGSTRELALRYGYFTDGRLRTLTLPNGAIVRWEYDAAGRTVCVPGLIKRIDYADDGAQLGITHQNGVYTGLAREADRRTLRGVVTSNENGELHRSGLTRASPDDVTEWLDGGSPRRVLADAMNRITGIVAADGASLESRVYRGDLRLGEIGGLALQYAEGGNLEQAGTEPVQTDVNGAVVSWGSRKYRRDGQDRILSLSDGASVRRYDTDQSGQVCAAYDEKDALVFYSPDPQLVETADGLYFVLHLGQLPVVRVRLLDDGSMAGAVHLHHDVCSRLALLTNAQAEVVKRFSYSAGGDITVGAGLVDEALDRLLDGHRYSPLGRCYLHGARLHAPALGRFLSADVVAYNVSDPLAGERYLYAAGHPLRYGDPSGLFLDDLWNGISRAWEDWGKKLLMGIAVVVMIIYGTIPMLIGMAVGAIVGGLSANARGGDVLEGMLGGALLGGLGAWGAGYATAGSSLSGVAVGALQGTIQGAAIGMAAGYAGGAGSWQDVLEGASRGALTGAVTGALFASAGEFLRNAKPAVIDSQMQLARSMKVLGETGNNSGSLDFGRAGFEYVQPWVTNTLLEAGKYVANSGVWVHVGEAVIASASGYQAGGFGKPLEKLIWEDVLNQHAEISV